MTCQLNKPQCIRCQIPLTPITSNECLIFHTKELNSKASGPWSQLQLSSILDLDDTFHNISLRNAEKIWIVHNVTVNGKKFHP